MEITKLQRDSWMKNPETHAWESVIGPLYKDGNGSVDVERLFAIADANGLQDLRVRYAQLNPGQIAMNVRNRLRPIWRAGKFRIA